MRNSRRETWRIGPLEGILAVRQREGGGDGHLKGTKGVAARVNADPYPTFALELRMASAADSALVVRSSMEATFMPKKQYPMMS